MDKVPLKQKKANVAKGLGKKKQSKTLDYGEAGRRPPARERFLLDGAEHDGGGEGQ